MILHMIVWDHPSVSSTRSQKALCGIYSHPRAMAKDRDDVNCPTCREALKAVDDDLCICGAVGCDGDCMEVRAMLGKPLLPTTGDGR